MTIQKYHMIFFILLATATEYPASAQEDVRRVKLRVEETRVIEEKCMACHNRQRIDAAVKERMEMEKILRRMEKNGVVLTDKERRVMGHFWGQKPYKSKE